MSTNISGAGDYAQVLLISNLHDYILFNYAYSQPSSFPRVLIYNALII